MFAYIKGIVAYKNSERAIIETGGIGYELCMSVHALASLPATGNPAQIWTYLQAKEDGVSLFGFSDPAEKEIFCQLIAISGVGPRIAISALSTFKPKDLVSSIAAQDIAAISTIPGIGKKTAQRIVLELQGVIKSDVDALQAEGIAGDDMRDATAALESMGFSAHEISAALKGCTQTSIQGIIQHALRHMGGNA